MEKVRWIAMGLKVCRWYLIAFHVLFSLFSLFVLFLYTEDPSIRDYCIYASPGEPYDFVWGEDTFCRIDWMFFIRELLFLFLLTYLAFSVPAWILWLFLRRARKMATKAGS